MPSTITCFAKEIGVTNSETLLRAFGELQVLTHLITSQEQVPRTPGSYTLVLFDYLKANHYKWFPANSLVVPEWGRTAMWAVGVGVNCSNRLTALDDARQILVDLRKQIANLEPPSPPRTSSQAQIQAAPLVLDDRARAGFLPQPFAAIDSRAIAQPR